MSTTQELNTLRVRTAETLAHGLHDAGIRYVMVNGLYGYPEKVGRDLDILIRKKDAPQAIAIAERVRQDLGWDSVLLRWSPMETWQIFFIKQTDETLLWLEVDLMHEMNMLMGAAPLVPDFDATVCNQDGFQGPIAVSKLGYYIKSQFRPIFYGHLDRFENKYALEPVRDPEIQSYLKHVLGERTARDFVSRTQQGVSAMRGIGGNLKRAINLRYMLHHPLAWVRNLFWSRVIRPWNLYWKSSGLVFAVVRPDGEPNTHALDEAVTYFSGCFQTRRESFPEKTSDHVHLAGHARRPGFLRSWWNATSWLIRLTRTYYGRDRFLPRSVIQFVIYDGSPRDLLRNPQRYGMAGGREIQWLRRLAPWPLEIQIGSSDGTGGVAPQTTQIEVQGGSPQDAPQIGSSAPEIDSRIAGREIARSLIAELERIYAMRCYIKPSDFD